MDDRSHETLTENESKVLKLRRWIKEGTEHLICWYKEAEIDYRYYAGDPWDPVDKEVMNNNGRPVIAFNYVARTVNAVIGIEVQSRQEVRFKPTEKDDSGSAEVLTETARYVRDNCDAEDEESEASQDNIICGIGFTETYLDYESNADGDIIVSRIDPLEMVWDPNAKKRNLDDARWLARRKKMIKDDFKELWPDEEPQWDEICSDYDIVENDATNAYKYEQRYSNDNFKEKLVTVFQIQWWERERFYRVKSETGKIIELDTEQFGKLKKYIEATGLEYVKQTRKRYKQAFVNGKNILEEGDLPVNRFTFRANTGLRDRNNNTWFGLVRLMRDPQQWANKWMSQILYIVNTNAKGGVLIEEGALANPRKFEEEWSGSPSPIIMLNDGAISQGKFQQVQPAGYPQGLDRLLQLAIDSVTDIAGVNLELLGLANRNQAGYLEDIRQKAGVTILAVFFDSLRRYRKEQGRVLADFIINYMTDGRIIRVVGKEGEKYVPLLRDKFFMEYDVVVDDAPASPNQKERIFQMLFQFLPLALQAGIPIPPEIIEYAPIPASLAERWKSMIIGNEQQDPVQEQVKQANAQLATLEVESKKVEIQEKISQTELNYARAIKEKALGADESAQAAHKMGLDYQAQQHKFKEIEMEQARKENEFRMAQQSKIKQMETDQAIRDSEFMLNERRKDKEFALEQKRKDLLANAQAHAKLRPKESKESRSNN